MHPRSCAPCVAGGDANQAIRQRVRALLKDLEFIDRLEQIRLQRATRTEGMSFDNAGAVRDYARAFRDHGVDVEQLPVETTIERLKTRPALIIPLAAALDDWISARLKVSERDAAAWKRLLVVARGIDPEPLRDRLRATWGQSASEVGEELRWLAESIEIRALHPATLCVLASRLQDVKHSDLAVRILRDAQYVYPGDFWLNFVLGHALAGQKDHEGAIRFYTAAVSVRPNSAGALNNLGSVLSDQKKLDEAMAAYRKAIELDPKNTAGHYNLGVALKDQGKLDDAITCCNKAIELDPNDPQFRINRAAVYRQMGQWDKAVADYCKVIELDQSHANAWWGRGHIHAIRR